MYTRIGSDPLLMSITRELCVTIFILVRGILKGVWFSQFRCDDWCDEGKYETQHLSLTVEQGVSYNTKST
jgi:hypothetical protein